jgi:hypothetical protein
MSSFDHLNYLFVCSIAFKDVPCMLNRNDLVFDAHYKESRDLDLSGCFNGVKIVYAKISLLLYGPINYLQSAI